MKIGFATADWSQTVDGPAGHPAWGGSGWARIGQFMGKLEQEHVYGILISKNGVFGVRAWDSVDHFDCDIMVIQRYMLDLVAENIPKAKASGQTVINDLDDWFWGLSPSNHAWLSSHPKQNPNENINHYKRSLVNSDYVTVSTEYLKERIQGWCRGEVVVIPNCVDFDRFKEPKPSDELTIGWVGSTSHRSSDLETIGGILQGLKGFKFHHSGHCEGALTFAEATGLDPELVSTSPMMPPELYPEMFCFDIGLAPISDIPFNLAKSAIKALEYSAAKVPYVASSIGEYQKLYQNFNVGRTAKKGQWKAHLEILRDPDQRSADIARNSLAKNTFDLPAGIKRLENFFGSL